MEISPNHGAGQQHLFVVRLWREPHAGEIDGEWRGFVEHVGTKEKRYFRDATTIAALLAEMIEALEVETN